MTPQATSIDAAAPDGSVRSAPGARVVVIGAGLSGLGAAWRLRSQGCDVTVIERGEEAGGRAAGRFDEGFSVERSLPVLRQSDRHLTHWIHELGLSESLLPLRATQLAQIYRGEVATIDPTSRTGVARMPGVRRIDGWRLVRLPRLMRRYRSKLDPDHPERAARWDDRSVADFARLYFGSSSFERWIAPEISSACNSSEFETSRVALLLDWCARRDGAARHGVPRGPLHELTRQAAEELGVRFGTTALRIEPRALGYHVHVRPEGRAETHIEAEAVVVATAATEAGRIAAPVVTPAERDYLRDVSFAPSVTLTVALERPVSGLPMHVRVPRVEGSPVQSFLMEAGLPGGRAPEGCGLVTVAATEAFGLSHAGMPDANVRDALLDAVQKIQPRIGALARFARLERRHRAIPHFQVGAYRALDRFQRVQRDRRARGRRLYFAGDHLAGPGAEEALGSGLRVAGELASDFS